MNSAIIVAAGRGTRMGPNVDKLFLEIGGIPIVGHTWQRFDGVAEIDEILIVTREDLRPAFEELAIELDVQLPWRLVLGGAARQDSVANGLDALAPATEIVAIQDGARPCTTKALIRATMDAARESGAAVAAMRVTDTVKESADGRTIARHLDREKLWAVQTPQTFRVSIIRRALATARERGLVLTDDTAACELIGQPVRLVESATPNPKVTVPADLPYVELLLREQG
ncbi:MAG: 2-C-methyl-D-erythritol 4-phosphate cytidylyltransferase [Verrucomicrobia bacterium]|nr:2-C-methyl-D-erythritol 4-phosphate cytidylyltransferase [Verrucomicrobiota bacterium]